MKFKNYVFKKSKPLIRATDLKMKFINNENVEVLNA